MPTTKTLPRIDMDAPTSEAQEAAIAAEFALRTLIHDRLYSGGVLAKIEHTYFVSVLLGTVDRYAEALAALEDA